MMHVAKTSSLVLLLGLSACAGGREATDAGLPSTDDAVHSRHPSVTPTSVHIREYSLKSVSAGIGGVGNEIAVGLHGTALIPSSDSFGLDDILSVAPDGHIKTLVIPNPECGSVPVCTYAEGGVAYRSIDETIWYTVENRLGFSFSGGVQWMNASGKFLGGTESPNNEVGSTDTGNVVIGRDGRAWFPQCGDGNYGPVCQLSAASETTGEQDYDLQGYAGNTVANGADGDLYLTENVYGGTVSNVAHISLTGKVLHRFALPAGSVVQFARSGIASDVRGNLWIVEHGLNEIARLNPRTGALVQFPIPTSNADAHNIVLGADQNMWFTESLANKIGRITPSGVVTEYDVPTPNAYPSGIAGPPQLGCPGSAHGYLWFTEAGNSPAVARLTF